MKIMALILAGLGFLVGKCWALEPQWQEVTRGIVNVKAVLLNQDNPGIIYIGTDRGIFRTEDNGSTWKSVFSIRGDNHNLNYLAADAQDKKTVYAATGGGIYCSNDAGDRWRRVFKGRNAAESDCRAIAVFPQLIYSGTRSGLFVSKDKGRSWRKEAGKLGESRIFNIASLNQEPNFIYVACSDGVFKSADSGASWERVYITHTVESESEEEEKSEDDDEEGRYSEIRYLAIDPAKTSNIYMATIRGIYQSKDRGTSWELLPEYGLLSHDVQSILVAENSALYAAAKSGAFVYKQEAWRELSFNLVCRYINFLALDKDANLYACTEKGLFRSNLKDTGGLSGGGIITDYCQGEPKIEEVQKQAIRYAEVEPQKIINWRKQARHKAILPQVSIGLDRNSSDLWHWESGSSTKNDDDTLRRGRDNLDWDVRLSWDLSELIWNNEQTSIDVRSRLMVQLRDDILDEVNKLYFERIRVKMELDNLQIEDRKKRFEKELRVQELTASLDALTGGYFSSQIQSRHS